MSETAERLTVLLIEDDQEDILVLRRVLQDSNAAGIQISVATSLAAGLVALRVSRPDAVLLDLRLPDADRLEGLQIIRNVEPEVPIVIMSGLDDEDLAMEAVQKGAQDYLVKGSVETSTVRHALRHAIERHRLQRQLFESQKREHELQTDKLESLGRLAGGIAHDFNNLLMGIMGNLSLAKSAQGKELAELLDEAEKASERATSLARQLLTFSKGGEPIKKVAAVGPLVRDTVSFALRGSMLSAEYVIPEGLFAVEIDTGQIAQVFQNIVLNACQAMPQGGRLQIRAENCLLDASNGLALMPGEYVHLVFKDEGLGIPEKILPRIFEPYFTTKAKGSGLGLATALSIIQKHGGTMAAASEAGHGATFHLYLPASTERPSPHEAVSIRPRFNGGRILVMDDEAQLRKLVANYLGRLGFEVTLAADGAEALDLYGDALKSGRTFTAVIADLAVPGGMGGIELVSRILSMDPHAKVIVSSGYSGDAVMSKPHDAGFCGVVTKPYRLEELVETLARVLPSIGAAIVSG